jgi:hypothetical protein
MSEQPYDPRLITPSVYGHRRPVRGEVVALLHITFEERGLKLIQSRSRAMAEKEIHELMITDEADAGPGGRANRVSAIAFFEVERGGLAVFGDDALLDGVRFGCVAGYDMTHMPNHMNVLVRAESLERPPIRVGSKIRFSRPR